MRRAKKFESAAHRIAMARIKASPKLWREYLKRRGSWLYLLSVYGLFLLVAFVGVFGMLSLPFAAGVNLASPGTAIGVPGAITVALAAAIVLGHANWLVQELLCSRSLAIASQLPIADDELVSNRLRRMVLASLLLLVMSLTFFVGVITRSQLSWQDDVQVLGLAVLEWIIGVALMVLIPAYLPRVARRETFGILTTLGFGALLLSSLGPAFKIIGPKTVPMVVLGALPTGWPLLMLEFGILRDGPIAIWWLLLPSAILVTTAVFAVGHFKRLYDVAEIAFDDNGLASAVLTRHFEGAPSAADEDSFEAESQRDQFPIDADSNTELPAARVGLGQLIRGWFGKAEPEVDGDECDAEFARERVLSREFLKPFDWSRGRWMESTVGSMLNDREQLVADLLAGGAPQWTKRQTKTLIVGLASVLSFFLLSLWIGQGARPLVAMICGQVCFGIFLGTLSGAWPTAIGRSRTGHCCSITGTLPITTTELLRLTMILGAVRAAYLTPFFFGLAVMGVFCLNGQWDFGRAAYIAAKAVLVFVAMHQWAMLLLIPVTDSWPLWRKVVVGLLLGFLIAGAIAAAVWLFYVGQSEIKSFIAAALIFGIGWLAQKWHYRAMTRQPYDFITMPRQDFALQQMQQSQRRDRTKVW